MSVIILPGVTIGENSVIGAGAVVADDIPPNCVAVGVPAKPVGFFGSTNVMPENSIARSTQKPSRHPMLFVKCKTCGVEFWSSIKCNKRILGPWRSEAIVIIAQMGIRIGMTRKITTIEIDSHAISIMRLAGRFCNMQGRYKTTYVCFINLRNMLAMASAALVTMLGSFAAVFTVYGLYVILVLRNAKTKEYLDLIAQMLTESLSPQSLPNVTVLIPTCNESAVISGKLQNIAELEYPHEKIEVIMVDDCSSDNTCEVAEKMFRELGLQGKIMVFHPKLQDRQPINNDSYHLHQDMSLQRLLSKENCFFL